MTPDGIQFQRPQPHPTDPEKCLFEHWWLVPDMEQLSASATFMGSDTTENTAGEEYDRDTSWTKTIKTR